MKHDTNEDLLSLPIDQFSRQSWAYILIEHIKRQPRAKILDVGGYKGKTHLFHPEDDVIICDLFDVKEPNYVKGDGRELPFADNEFDFVVTFDTYEHVPREGREAFIKELVRVAQNGVILAAPFDDENGSVFQAEVDLNDYHKKLYNDDHQWLKEHIDYRIPSKEELDVLLDSINLFFTSVGSNDLSVWILMQTLYFSIGLDEDLRGRIDDVNRYYNRELAHLDLTNNQSYRQIYFISKNENTTEQIKMFIREQKNALTEESKAHFIAYALSVCGKKYRDVQMYKNYLEQEIKQRDKR